MWRAGLPALECEALPGFLGLFRNPTRASPLATQDSVLHTQGSASMLERQLARMHETPPSAEMSRACVVSGLLQSGSCVASGLARVGVRSAPRIFGVASQPNAGKPARHTRLCSPYKALSFIQGPALHTRPGSPQGPARHSLLISMGTFISQILHKQKGPLTQRAFCLCAIAIRT